MSTPLPPEPQPGQPGQPGQPVPPVPDYSTQQAGGYATPQGYPQGYGAPAYPAPSGPRPKGPAMLGIIAAVASIVGTVVGAVIVAIATAQITAATYEFGMSVDSMGQAQAEQLGLGLAGPLVLVVLGWGVYGVLSLWGIIQGIVATVQNKGRGWGIAAIVVGVLGSIVVLIAMSIGAAIGLPVDAM